MEATNAAAVWRMWQGGAYTRVVWGGVVRVCVVRVCVCVSLSLSRPLFDDCLVSIWDVVTFTVVRLHLTLSLYLFFFFHFARLPQIDCVARQVYAMEKLEAEKVVYHKACFRCTECNKAVSLGTYASLHNKVDT